MKILISADMEGASGIISARECAIPYQAAGDPLVHPSYFDGKRWLTQDINVAVEGAMEAGATEFVLHDSHGLDYPNVNLEELHPSVEVVRGMPIVFYEPADLDPSYDAAFMIAMHAGPGEPGLISHALDWPSIRQIRFNGKPVGEEQITAAMAGYYEIPTVLITGDDLVCNSMKTWTGGQIETAIVKKSFSRYSGRLMPFAKAHELIRKAAQRAVERKGDIKPFKFETPITLEVDLIDRQVAWYASWMPQIKYDGGYTVSYTDKDFMHIYNALNAILWIVNSKLNVFLGGANIH